VGGVSKGPFESLNLGATRGDDINNVLTNYKLLSKAVGFNYNNVVFSGQVHGKEIYHATEKDKGKGLFIESDIKNIDGLMTGTPDIVLTTFYADCTPLFFVDTAKKIIAISHSGWKGTVLKIGSHTLDEMQAKYNSELKDTLIGIGPSLCQECFEVDPPVYHEFESAFDNINLFTAKRGEKYYIDLKLLIKQMFLDKGVPENNIEVSGYCTKCMPNLFYSHRYSGQDRGSLAGFIELLAD
jgi:YfiH family protein